MKLKHSDLLETIPIALGELRVSGHEPAYFDEIGLQVTKHDEVYLQRRKTVRNIIGRIGIRISELPSGFSHPGPKMYPALAELQGQGLIRGEFEEPRNDGKPSRMTYRLVDQTPESEV
jgi:hypothetical protein